MKKRRGHGWTRRKNHSKKVSVSIASSQIPGQSVSNQASRSRNLFTDPIHIPPLPEGTAAQDIIDEIRERMHERRNGHSLECYYFANSRNCIACMNC